MLHRQKFFLVVTVCLMLHVVLGIAFGSLSRMSPQKHQQEKKKVSTMIKFKSTPEITQERNLVPSENRVEQSKTSPPAPQEVVLPKISAPIAIKQPLVPEQQKEIDPPTHKKRVQSEKPEISSPKVAIKPPENMPIPTTQVSSPHTLPFLQTPTLPSIAFQSHNVSSAIPSSPSLSSSRNLGSLKVLPSTNFSIPSSTIPPVPLQTSLLENSKNNDDVLLKPVMTKPKVRSHSTFSAVEIPITDEAQPIAPVVTQTREAQDATEKESLNHTLSMFQKTLPSTNATLEPSSVALPMIGSTQNALAKWKQQQAERQYNSLLGTVIRKNLYAPRKFPENLFVEVQIQIGVQGNLEKFSVTQKSTNVTFDLAVTNAVKNAEYPPLPEALEKNPPYIVKIKVTPQ